MKEKLATYYEQSSLWSNYPIEKERSQEIIKSIPSDVKSVLDVGCGNGELVNTIINDYPYRFKRVGGLDISCEALKYVKSEKYLGDVTQLPFNTLSFDLVISSEVLEHLPYHDLKKGISEIQRVSKKYIIITVPNDEDLESDLRYCPNCSCWFNKHYHMNSFNQLKLKELFYNAQAKYVKEIGPIIEQIIYNDFTRLWFNYKKKYPPAPYSICPQCGYQIISDSNKNYGNKRLIQKKESNYIVRSIKILFKPLSRYLYRIIFPKIEKKRWLLAFYEK